jgi:hypothetical protein
LRLFAAFKGQNFELKCIFSCPFSKMYTGRWVPHTIIFFNTANKNAIKHKIVFHTLKVLSKNSDPPRILGKSKLPRGFLNCMPLFLFYMHSCSKSHKHEHEYEGVYVCVFVCVWGCLCVCVCVCTSASNSYEIQTWV